ncbi:MAG: phage tail assembly chaperone [Sphaerochaeta sp.]|jgi:hypothetical protein|nr:phage tail assembly chaperone [Sphaerochaeta sp.]
MRYWKNGDDVYCGDPFGDAVELTENQYQVLMVEDEKQFVRNLRDQKIREVEWRVRRYQDEQILGLPHLDDIVRLATYIQALRDVPQQAGFPDDVVWPVLD